MRYREITEAIQNKPYDLGLYVRNRIKELKVIISEFETAKKLIEDNEANGDRMLDYWVRYGSDADAAHNIQYAISLGKRYETFFPLENLLRSLQNYLDHGSTFLRFVLGAFKYTEEVYPEALAAFEALHTATVGAQEYGFVPGDPENDKDEEYVAAMGLLRGLTILANTVSKAKMFWQNLFTKLSTVEVGSYSYRPEHDDVETLYHASIHCNEIIQHGFSAEKPDGRRGLGSLGFQTTISFTHQLEIARNIMRCLKEIWMIAHDDLTADQIIKWIRHENLENDVRKMYGNNTPLNKIPTIILYRYWLALTKSRVDPVFVSPQELIPIMQGVKFNDIGVLACEVKLDKKDEYLAAEAEFRLPADRVISVSRKL